MKPQTGVKMLPRTRTVWMSRCSCRLKRNVSHHHSTRKLYHKGKSILHGRPVQTAGLNFVSSSIVLANLVISWLCEPIVLTCSSSAFASPVATKIMTNTHLHIDCSLLLVQCYS